MLHVSNWFIIGFVAVREMPDDLFQQIHIKYTLCKTHFNRKIIIFEIIVHVKFCMMNNINFEKFKIYFKWYHLSAQYNQANQRKVCEVKNVDGDQIINYHLFRLMNWKSMYNYINYVQFFETTIIKFIDANANKNIHRGE